MPFYEYQCTACGHRIEALQKISDDPLVYCPECNEATLKKLISAAAFRLKGTGWYETDFKNSGSKEAKEKSADPGSGSGEKKSTDGGEAKKSGGGDKPGGSGGSGESQAA
jgi:putative FmdB family regulatory protein